ncbi:MULTISPECIES: efflux RND transporter periplasmic adaptor subunit [Sphingobacterium]|uniref:efflux RND transporter periplasmic adaptor subunit n=1 Tax=Sphingobacterium TaxID=28453 RepID=UPI0012FE2314|nr:MULTISPECIES: efflux RND transporter periplasmic adaptor subunit [Sphingobacterium]QRQ62304.1 efflux RND transporter periplasmic adaptor subunit [Sphingobacterium multivorum]
MGKKSDKKNTAAEEIKPDSVQVTTLDSSTLQKSISLPGNLLPYEKVEIRAKVPGYIKSLNVDLGSKVTKGQILALVDAPEINSRLQELIAKEKMSYSNYQSSLDYYDRINKASKSDGVVAASELEKAKSQMLADEANYNASKFAAKSYRQVGNYLAIVAPYTGIITKRNINIGSFVGNLNEPPLFEIEDNRILRLQIPVPEIYSGAQLMENKGELTTSSFPDKLFTAVLSRKSGSINSETRSELWEFEVQNPDLKLKPGSFANVNLKFARTQPSFIVPNSAVLTTLERRFVIVISNGITKWIDVRNGLAVGEKQEIFGNLKIGDLIVLKPNEELKPDKKVITKQ